MTNSDVLLRIAIALPFGLVFGSFLTVAIHRVPAGESLVRPRSRCPTCGTPLRNVDNIPVVSWLMLRGRCHACGARISAVYPLTEVATGALFVAVALVYEDPWQAILLAPFCGILVALSVIGYTTEIRAPQARHRPRSISQDTTGMLSTLRSGVPQLGHRDRGRTRESPAGTRWITTVRKLPNTKPNGRAIAIRSSMSEVVMGGRTLPQAPDA